MGVRGLRKRFREATRVPGYRTHTRAQECTAPQSGKVLELYMKLPNKRAERTLLLQATSVTVTNHFFHLHERVTTGEWMVNVNINPGYAGKGKRKATPKSSYARLAAAKKQQARKGYSTVARTRGVYAQGEMKYFDTERALASIPAGTNWTGTEFDPNTTQEGTPVANPNTLFCPVVGSAINERIGRQAKVHKIKVRGHLNIAKLTTQTGSNSCLIRLLLVQDDQTNSAQVQGEEIMTDPVTASAHAVVDVYQALTNFGRFKVLKDHQIVMQNPNAVATDDQMGLTRPFKWNIDFKAPIAVRFNATNGGTVADVVDVSWHVLAACSNADLVPQITYQARVCYKE